MFTHYMVLYLQKAAKNKVVYALDNFIYKKLIKIILIHCILLLNHNNSTFQDKQTDS